MARKHAHYFRSVSHVDEIDVYRVLELFNVTDQALGHAIKKLLAPGGRGAGKDFRKDVQEAVDTLQRRLEMLDEDAHMDKATPAPEPDQTLLARTGAMDGDGWVKWFGGVTPPYLHPSVVVEYMRAGGLRGMNEVGSLDWSWGGCKGPAPDSAMCIVRYRVVPNRGG